MRISTNQMFDAGMRGLNDQQGALLKVQQQLSAQRRVLTPADDPIAAGREVSLDASLRISGQMVENQKSAKSQLEQTENYLVQARDALNAVRSRVLQGGGGTLSEADRQSIVADLTSLREQLLGVANSQDEDGDYVFAGYKRDTQPFVQTSGGVAYQGDGGVRQSQIGPNRHIDTSFSGSYLFEDVPAGNGGVQVQAGASNAGSLQLTGASIADRGAWDAAAPDGPYTVEFGTGGSYAVTDAAGAAVATGTLGDSGSIDVQGVKLAIGGTPVAGDTLSVGPSSSQSLFDTLDQAISALGLPASPQESTQRANAIFAVLANVDGGLDRLEEARASVGARINEIDASTTADTARGDAMTAEMSRVVGSDPESLTQMAVELAKRTYTVQAAQLSYTTISKLSIFNYL